MKQHKEAADTIELIDTLPPGLYEMLIDETHTQDAGTEQEHEEYEVRFQSRTIEDIRALDDSRDDERPFATAAKISEINEDLYDTFMKPFVLPWGNDTAAAWLRLMHPQRFWRLAFSDLNPAMWPVRIAADLVRVDRRPVSKDNPLLSAERAASEQIESGLNAYRDIVTTGWNSSSTPFTSRQPPKPSPAQRGPMPILPNHGRATRSSMHCCGAISSRSATKQSAGEPPKPSYVCHQHDELKKLSHQQIKEIVRKQALLVRFNRERAMESLPKLLPTSKERDDVIAFVRDLVGDSARPQRRLVEHQVPGVRDRPQ